VRTNSHLCFSELKETESAHREALVELQKMRDTMDTMEQERADMVAEVEAQIEKALASMAVDIEDSDEDDDSRPGSRMSSSSVGRPSRPNSRASRSRRTSDAGTRKQLRSFGTESTLVETYEIMREEAQGKLELAKEEVIEEEDEAPQSPTKKNRFSASGDGQQDGMTAVDEGISERSDRIAAKVLQIQQKVESLIDHS
jgi:nicotinamide N-methyltransferase